MLGQMEAADGSTQSSWASGIWVSLIRPQDGQNQSLSHGD